MYTSNDPKVVAQSFVNQAIGSYNSGNNYDAQVNLARALVTNPELKNDPEIRQLASKYTGLDVETALKRLTTPARNSPRNDSNSREERAPGGDHWLTVLLELILLFVTVAFTSILIQSLGRGFATEIAAQAGNNARMQAELSRLMTLTEPGAVLRGALSYSAGTVGVLIGWNIIMYAFCIAALGGAGGILSHMSATFRVQIGSYLLLAATMLIFVLSFRTPLSTRQGLIQLSLALTIINGLGTVGVMIYFISRVHQFDMVKGFVAVVLSPIIISCGLCGLLYVAQIVR